MAAELLVVDKRGRSMRMESSDNNVNNSTMVNQKGQQFKKMSVWDLYVDEFGFIRTRMHLRDLVTAVTRDPCQTCGHKNDHDAFVCRQRKGEIGRAYARRLLTKLFGPSRVMLQQQDQEMSCVDMISLLMGKERSYIL